MIGWRASDRGIAAVALLLCVGVGCSRQSSESSSPPAAVVPTPPPPSGAGPHEVTGKSPAAVNGVPSIVVLTPPASRQFPPPAEKPFMDQVTLTFIPSVLFVRTGHPTEFRNSDDVLHNVRVRETATKEGLINVAIINGGVYSYTFERDGFYDVGCDIHPGMSALIIASRSPYAAQADVEGNFYFEDVEPGPYTVTVFSGTEKIDRGVEIRGAKTDLGQLKN